MKNKVYLFPYNDISFNLSKNRSFLIENEILGYIDNYKKEGVSLKDIIQKFDYILICSPNYYINIYNQLLQNNISVNKIKFYVNSVDKIINKIDLFSFLYYKNIESYKYIKELKNKHLGRRAFLIGNGPSLKIEDLERIKDEVTFAANKIYLAFNETKWRPTYYFVEDDLVYKQNYDEIKNLKNTTKFFPQYALDWGDKIDDAYYFNLKYFPDDENFPNFCPNPIDGMYWGSTVIYTMIQWAVYLGFKEIYLLGVDFNFIEPDNYVINEYNRRDLICEGEINHFHKDYRKIGEKWNLPNLDIQLKSFKKAKAYAEKAGIKIINISNNSKLNVYDKKKLYNII